METFTKLSLPQKIAWHDPSSWDRLRAVFAAFSILSRREAPREGRRGEEEVEEAVGEEEGEEEEENFER